MPENDKGLNLNICKDSVVSGIFSIINCHFICTEKAYGHDNVKQFKRAAAWSRNSWKLMKHLPMPDIPGYPKILLPQFHTYLLCLSLMYEEKYEDASDQFYTWELRLQYPTCHRTKTMNLCFYLRNEISDCWSVQGSCVMLHLIKAVFLETEFLGL